MTPELQSYVKLDEGYRQSCSQYNLVAGDPTVWNDYIIWLKDRMSITGIVKTAVKDAKKVWQAERDEIEVKHSEEIADKDATIADKDASLAAQAAEISHLRAQLETVKSETE